MDMNNRAEKRWFFGFSAVLAVLAVGLLWFSAIDANPVIKIENPKPPQPNAYDYYVAAGNSIVDDAKVSWAVHMRPKGWKSPVSSPDDRYYSPAEREAIILKNTAVLKTLREGFEYDYLDPVAWEPHPWSGRRYYAKFRELARLIRIEASVYAEKGDYAGAVNSCIDGVHLGADIPKGGGVLGCLVGDAMEAITLVDARNYADHLSAKDAKSAAKRLEDIVNHKYTLVQVYRDEKRSGLKLLSNIFSTRTWRKDIATMWWDISSTSPKPTEYVTSYARAFTMSKRVVFNNYANYRDLEIERCKQPYSAKTPDISPPNDPINVNSTSILKPAQFHYAGNGVSERLLLLNLALRAYKLEHGNYPNSLSELVPSYLTKVPIDPFGGGKAFKYKRSGDRYILYSLGPDCIDDGGKSRSDSYANQNSKGDIVVGVTKKI